MPSLKPCAARSLASAAALVAAVAVVYALSLRGDFLWDDDLHVTANPTIIGPLGLKEIWTTARANYFPLVLTNFWAQHALWGLNPLGYHLVTVLCHAVAAVLLWRVLVRLRIPGAWLGAALWALHPVQVESVAWICELKNTQSAVFFLAAILVWLRWLEVGRVFDPPSGAERMPEGGSKTRPTSRGASCSLALFCAVLALLSKPSTVMLPIALALVAWWQGGRLERRTVLALVPFFALSAVVAGWTIWEQKFHSGAQGAEWDQTFPARVLIAARAVWFYLGKLLWPAPLMFVYPRWSVSAEPLPAWLAFAAALAALVQLWRRRRVARGSLLVAVYFVALLFPVLGFFSVYFFRYSFVGDHFQYLASMAPLALLGALVARAPARAAAGMSAALILACGILSWRQSAMYHDNVTLWRTTVARNPTALMPRLNLADSLSKKGAHAAAIAAYQAALQLQPDEPDAHNDLGCQYVLAGRPAEGVPHLQRAIALTPSRPEPHNNLGNAWRALGRRDSAAAEYRRALDLKPDYPEALQNLGAEMAEGGRPGEAVPYFTAALRLKPKEAAAHNNLGNALRLMGRFEEACARHREALRLAPDFADAHASLGYALSLHGSRPEGFVHLQRAIELQPDSAAAHGYFGQALAAAGRAQEAHAHFQRAVQLAPNSAEARNNLGTLLAQTGRNTEALAEFEIAVRLAPQFTPARLNLGNAFGAAGRWPDAAAQFQAAVQAQPENADAQARLGVALVNMDRLQAAVSAFEAALRLNPQAADVHAQFAQVLRALGRAREALEHFERAEQLRRPPR